MLPLWMRQRQDYAGRTEEASELPAEGCETTWL
jgi:hypothetical protein